MDIPINYVAIGEAIRKKRALKGYSQRQVADIAGISAHHYSKIERGGEGHPKFETLYGIAVALDMSLDELLENVYNPESDSFISAVLQELRTATSFQRRLILENIKSIKDLTILNKYEGNL